MLIKRDFTLDEVVKSKRLERRILPDKTWELYYVLNPGAKPTFIVAFKTFDQVNWKMELNKISVDFQYSETEMLYENIKFT